MNKQPKCKMCDDTGWYFVRGAEDNPQLERCHCMRKTDMFFVVTVAVIVILCIIFTIIACF